MNEKDPSRYIANLQELKSLLIKYKESDNIKLLSDDDQMRLVQIIDRLENLTNDNIINQNQDYNISIKEFIQSITNLLNR